MKKDRVTKQAIQGSCLLVSKFRRFSCYKNWVKKDFIRCQAEHEGIQFKPGKGNQIQQWEILCRFAIRCGWEDLIPDLVIAPAAQKTKLRPTKRYTAYDGTNGFTKWRKIRYEALKRSKGRCECCGGTPQSTGEPLHVDHIKPKSIYPDLELDLSNLQVLCADCNIGKGNWDETNWREQRIKEEVDIDLDMGLLMRIDQMGYQ